MGFQQGLSGLNASSKNLEVIGNNVANANTYGSKESRAEFADMYATAMNGSGANSIGISVTVGAVAQQFTQGNITTTENPLDLAINGNGFFQLKSSSGQTFYSRNGQFKLDNTGFIVNNQGEQLMGYPADATGTILPGTAAPLQMPTAGIKPAPTKQIDMELNLDSSDALTAPAAVAANTAATAATEAASAAAAATAADTAAATAQAAATAAPGDLSLAAAATAAAANATTAHTNATAAAATSAAAATAATNAVTGAGIDLTDPATYNNATSLTVYDAKGQDVALTYYFQKAATDQWNVFVTANGTPLKTDANGKPAPSTTIIFPSNGSAPTSPLGDVNLDIPASVNAAGAQVLPLSGVQLNVAHATQYGAAFGVTNLSQDGYATGQLVGVVAENNGIITARYSNGQSKPAGQLEIATFRNPQGLQPLGGNAWARTAKAGDAIVGVPGNGNMGALQSGALEESNTDLTSELVNMIVAQRVYQANAQTIKTEDQILQTLVNLR